MSKKIVLAKVEKPNTTEMHIESESDLNDLLILDPTLHILSYENNLCDTVLNNAAEIVYDAYSPDKEKIIQSMAEYLHRDQREIENGISIMMGKQRMMIHFDGMVFEVAGDGFVNQTKKIKKRKMIIHIHPYTVQIIPDDISKDTLNILKRFSDMQDLYDDRLEIFRETRAEHLIDEIYLKKQWKKNTIIYFTTNKVIIE